MNYDAPNSIYGAPNAYYDHGGGAPKTMKKRIALRLKDKTDAELSAFALNHGTEVDAAPLVYTALAPPKAGYDTLLATYNTRLADVNTKQTALNEALVLKEQTRLELEAALRSRAGCVATLAGDDEAIIVAAGFEVAPSPAPIGEMPPPQNVKVNITETTGRLDLRWKPIYGAKGYLVDCRTHGATPGEWAQCTSVTTSKCSITGLTPGQMYAFRVRALGAAGQGPWSDEGVKMAV